ncbi:MAG: helix-turn-helix transcriptional regulator [Clostridia bacterium]|nr:helix-turn-helix transcriptional regulator [Clostridia bacterium]
MDKSALLYDSIMDTISFEFVSGVSKSYFNPHETEWRRFPYTVIVCAFDAGYTCEIRDEGVYRIKAGEAIVVPGGFVHRMIFENPGYLNCLHVSFTVFRTLDALSFFDVPRIIACTKQNSIAECVDELADRLNNGIPKFQAIFRIKCLAMDLLNAILEESEEKADIDTLIAGINALSPVLDFIRNNLDRQISRKTLAGIMSLSETRFHYVFKSIMKVSPMKYLRDARLQKAFMLVATTQLSINEISALTGYTDYSNFNRQFKSRFGNSPSEARKSLGRDFSLLVP